MRVIKMFFLVLLAVLAGCDIYKERTRSAASGPFVEQFAPLPPFKEIAVAISNGDFSATPTAEGQLPGWACEGSAKTLIPKLGNEPGRGSFFMVDLRPGDKYVLRAAEAIALTLHHYYRLEMDARGVPFTTWSIALVQTKDGKPFASFPLWPILSGAIPPSPVWEHHAFYFTATEGFARGQLSFAYESKGTNYGFRLGLGGIRLTDLGPVALALKPGLNLKVNPSLEMEPFEDGKIPGWPEESGKVVADPVSAHSGAKYFRVNDNKRCIMNWLAGGFVHSPHLVKASVWARGKGGKLNLFLDQYAAGYVRLAAQNSPQVELTGEWKRCEWEFEVSPETVNWGITIDINGSNTVDLDDMEVYVVPIKLPESQKTDDRSAGIRKF